MDSIYINIDSLAVVNSQIVEHVEGIQNVPVGGTLDVYMMVFTIINAVITLCFTIYLGYNQLKIQRRQHRLELYNSYSPIYAELNAISSYASIFVHKFFSYLVSIDNEYSEKLLREEKEKIKLLNSNYEKYEANLQLLTGKRNVYHLFVSALLVDMECLLDELQYLNYQFVQRGEKIKHEKSVSINLEKATEQEYLEAIESLLLENDISSKHILRFLSLLSKNKERLDELLEQIYEQANLKK